MKKEVRQRSTKSKRAITQSEQLTSKKKRKKVKSKSDLSPKKNTHRTGGDFLRYFAAVMIIGGILILLYPIVGNYLANRERSEAVSTYDRSLEELSEVEIKKQLMLAKKYNEHVFGRQKGIPSQEILYQKVMGDGDVMGTIDIPGIDIEALPFYHGTSYKTLDKGLGHFEESSIPIGGKDTRSVITGHSGVKNQVLFTDIRHLSEGDVFFVNILGERLAYEIRSFEEVLPSDVEKVTIESDKDMVTLLTCTPPGINTYRLLVNGHRIPYEKAIAQKVIKRNIWSYQTIVLMTLALCLFIFVILGITYRLLLRKSKVNVPEISRRAKRHIQRLINLTRGLFVCLLVTMIGVIIMAIYGYFQMKEDTELGSIDIGKTEELAAFNTDKILQANYEDNQIASVNIANYAEAKSKTQETINTWGIGKLSIPEMGIDLPILAGLNNDNLLNGVATYRQDQVLGYDNYVLMAHSINEEDVLLHRIKYLKKGDLVYTSDFQQVYLYEVTRNSVIQETEVDVIEQTKEPIITLLRCEGDIGTKYRRLVQGKLKKTYPIGKATSVDLEVFSFKKKVETTEGKLLTQNPISYWQQLGMYLAATILSSPTQTIVPLFLLLVLPVIFLSLIHV